MAASATFALKAGVWFRRGRLIMVSPDSQATACPSSGRNSTYRPVQISGASSDVEHSPALNMFDLKPDRLKSYSQAINEQIEVSIIETFNYVFGALAAELTSRQNTTFAFVTKLMLSVPGATIHTLRELFEDGANSIHASQFADHIRRLDPTSQSYFENQFFTKSYS